MRRWLGSFLFACFALGTGVHAGSIIEFKDGRWLRVPAYEIDGQWIRVDYENEAYVFFPLGKVARIDTEGAVAYRPHTRPAVRSVATRPVVKTSAPRARAAQLRPIVASRSIRPRRSRR